DQIEEYLLERDRIRDQHRKPAADRDLETLGSMRELDRVLHERVTIGFAALTDLAPRARVREQIVEQPRQSLRAPLEQLEILLDVVPVVSFEALANPL